MDKITMMKYIKLSTITIVLTLFTACKKETESSLLNKEKTTVQGVTPFQIQGINKGGNVTCDEVAEAVAIPQFQYTTGRKNYPFNANAFPSEVSVSSDGTYVSWSIQQISNFCVANAAVIVKGGPYANIYFYKSGERSDFGLHAPINIATGNPYGLGNITICYNLVEGCE